MVEEHLDLCLDAGINHEGIDAEVAKGQWEFQIFGKGSKKPADEMWIARYLLQRSDENMASTSSITASRWGRPTGMARGMDANFPTVYSREYRGQGLFRGVDGRALKGQGRSYRGLRTEQSHAADRQARDRAITDFSYGVADRGASIRVPHSFVKNGYKGYLEDRRPNSQGDPYQIASQILKTIDSVPKEMLKSCWEPGRRANVARVVSIRVMPAGGCPYWLLCRSALALSSLRLSA